MIYWNDFVCDGITYPLKHLHPEIWEFTQAAKGDKPEKVYKIRIIYSLHCFTVKGGTKLPYSDNRETRSFCFTRYEDSKMLPEIIKTLEAGYVYHTGRQNFLRIDQGTAKEYEVFFTVTRTQGVDLQIYIQSAYLRTRGHTPKAGKIRFAIIAYNTLIGKKISPPRR
ncbi:hypothetical protein [Colwellia sp. Bg11-28]|uniref:hypothetical protein n=1 Tax=Colwellia sp. Bg11-28 TaxID=2058305 RepID=UPI000C321651|nr:hypothetical protein [Colwellia sp. Bg11-28]PKH88314.1 hypothetical protein CXF79_06000 [Colwellia sp. Bg11-28]